MADPAPEELQFERAVPFVAETAPSLPQNQCVVCKNAIEDQYFHAQGQVICPICASRIQAGQLAPPATSLLRSALYGAGAALAGCAIYATIAIVTGLEIGLIAILVGIMVGKAIRHGSGGRGGRPQQILAVALTYFAITTSYIPVFIYQTVQKHNATQVSDGQSKPAVQPKQMSLGAALVALVALAAAAPFLSLGSGLSGLITLFIIFIGLQRAWRLTGRTDLLIMGPYSTAS